MMCSFAQYGCVKFRRMRLSGNVSLVGNPEWAKLFGSRMNCVGVWFTFN
jgi:hypothetical protein